MSTRAAEAAAIIAGCWRDARKLDALPEAVRPRPRSLVEGFQAQAALAAALIQILVAQITWSENSYEVARTETEDAERRYERDRPACPAGQPTGSSEGGSQGPAQHPDK